jgi:dynein heavy chain
MTLTGALHLKFGGAPQGPAGTGKTETTKDLAKALGMQCVVFNCSDGLDYKMMGRFFSGLAQAGAWSCFDEFNRIDIEVLSVIAQQILVIQQGLVAKAATIQFEGREIPLSPCFGVFITMNPGYAGRTELPDNLKALFRPVAMMVPDYRLIAEIILFSQGFTDALKLSYKMVQLYKLSSEQLSKQDHYDFGMRAVKSVLVAAGQLKRKEPEVDENILLIRAMRDSNVPKFLEHDLPLFKGIISDLFPGVEVPFVNYGKLQTAIEDQLELAGLQRVPALMTKIIQTHETQLVRHGMMIVGETGSGKSVNHEILAKALSQLKREGVTDKDGFFQHVTRFTLNPKSITMGELYGEFNLTTQEWRDGLVATLVREAVKDTSANRKWIVFDGPVDALWIENMNTVLDDNKMLCLANGERIKLPPTVHMVFEVRDLAVASPATVSRCGMVYMEPLHVGVSALLDTWAEGEIADLLPEEAPRILGLIRAHVPEALAFLRGSCSEVIASQDSNLVQSFLALLLTLLRPHNGVRAASGCVGEPRTAAQKAQERWEATHGKTDAPPVDADGAGGEAGGEAAGAAAGAAPAPVAAAPARRGHGVKGALDAATLGRVVDISYVFAFVWSFGCNLHDRSRDKFNAFAGALLRDLLPPALRGSAEAGAGAGAEGGDAEGGADAIVPAAAGTAGSASAAAPSVDLFGFYVDVPSASLKDWRGRMPPFTYVPDTPYFNILVPTVDTTRYSYLFQTLVDAGRNVLFSGETGVGKSVIVADSLARMCAGDDARFASAVVNFSAQTKSANLQEALEASLDKKRKNLLGAPAGKRMVVYVDDLNMPQQETYGAQPPIELLRQVIDQGGFYDRQRLFFKQVASVVFAAACAPPGGGRNDVTPRLTRHYHMVWLPQLSAESMVTIFDAILHGFLANEAPALAGASRDIVSASVELYRRVEAELLPTPAKSHYTFNLRDLSKVFQGMLMVGTPELPDRDALLRLWVHEEQRVFRDRLISAEDRDWFNAATAELLAGKLGAPWRVADFDNVTYGDYLTKGGDAAAAGGRPYQRVNRPDALAGVFGEYLEEYNVTFPSSMALVFFRDAIAHVSRIARILRQPRGNALLVGVGGSGRRSLCRLAAFMAEYQCSSIEITRGYDVGNWHEDLKRLLMAAGIKGRDIVFLFSDTQIVKESFLEDINNVLNSGDVPNLYAPDEMEQIIGGCRAACKAAGKVDTRANIFAHYIQTAREHLHIVLCMSPIGAAFRTRCRQFPSLVNCCTIDWFNAWPEDALSSVARSFLADPALSLGPLVDPLCGMCVRIHTSVEGASRRYLAEQRRHNYTTPTSYLELLRLYVQMLQAQREVVSRKVSRYRGGLTKLAATNAMVADLQAQLKDLQPTLAKAAADTATLLEQLAKDQAEADAAAAVAAKDEAETAVVARNVAVIKDDCQKDLDEALPAYYAAMKALKSLDKKQIQEVKSFPSPPRMVATVLEAVCILMGYKETWDEAKKLMNQMNFLEQLMSFDKDAVNPKVMARITKYVKDPEFTPEVVSKVSMAATSLCLWVRAIYKYDEVARTIAPKKEKLAAAEAELAAAQTVLDEKRAALAKIQARLAELQASYNASLAKRQELDAQQKATALRLERAHKLTGGLGDEAVRWSAAAKQLEEDATNLVGNMVLASGCVAYLGAFTAGYRADLIRDWVSVCAERGVPVDRSFSMTRLLADPVVVREWNIQGLPADDFSTENGLYGTLGRRWPLMIDPQGQANRWVKNINKDRGLQVIKLSQADFLRTLENAIRFGQPVLLENVGEELDPALEPVLLKQTFKKGGQMCLRLGDSDVPYSDDFRLFITTKLANPHYMPEVCIKVTVINFTVTLRGLEDQLLVDVVRQERPDLEARKDELIVSIAGDKRALKEIEDTILQLLADSTGDILDDEGLINSLAASKTTSVAIGDRMREAEVTTREISEARETYRPVATRGSILYFVIADLALVDSMYQFSLQAFSRLYNLRISKAPKADTPAARVAVLIDDITRAFYANVCRGLFETHKLLYAFMIGAQVMRASGAISDAEWSAFMLGPTAAAAAAGSGGGGADVPPSVKSWLQPKAWAGLSAMAAAAPAVYAGLLDDIRANAGDAWRLWVTGKAPESEPLPGRWARVHGGVTGNTPTPPGTGGGLSSFQRLLVLRAAREEKTVQGVREFVRQQIGPFYTEPPPFDLEGTYADSSSQTPIIFILSPGADPIDSLLKLARAKGKSTDSFRIISLGQGQGPIAEAMMEAARKSGDWVCLQNCHLAVSWLPRMEALLEAAASGPANEHPDYRLWLTSMPSDRFPVPVLQNAIKITNEPPRGIKANLIRTFNDVGEREWDGSTKPAAFKRLLFGLAFYHALVLERRKFGAVGWNISYDFANSDLKAGIMQLRMYLEEQPGVPYETLNNVVGDITYGGRVTDKWDKRTNLSLLSRFFCPELLAVPGFKLSESGTYFCPEPGPLAALRGYIEGLPLEDSPEVFGLHENASITLQLKETGELMSTIMTIQPRGGGGGGGASGGGAKSADETVVDMVTDITRRMPAPLTHAGAHPATFAKIADGSLNSLGVFLEQEISRFNRLLRVMRGSLEQLHKAVKGLVVMSASLETMYTCFLLQRVPPEWEAAAYPSLKPLASWCADLFARIASLAEWVRAGPPASFWISGFFFPQGFMTGALQVHARKTRLAIDTLDFRTDVMAFTEDSVPAPPPNGVYIHGLFLEGARWDREAKRLADSAPGVLFDRLPCVWLDPVLIRDLSYGEGTYTCPFYKTSKRAGVLTTTGHSSNFVMTLFLPSDKPQEHWVRRGAAVLSMLDD